MKTDNDREKDNSVRLSVTIAFGDQQHSTDGLVYRQVHTHTPLTDIYIHPQ